MKNIFKFLGLAIIAGSMAFTSCNEDTVDAFSNTLNKVTIDFDGTETTMYYKQGLFEKDGNWFKGYDRYLRFMIAYDKNDNGFRNPYLNFYAYEDKDTYVVDTEHSEFYFDQTKIDSLSKDIKDIDDDGNLVVYSDWSIYSVASTSTMTFDASSMKFSANMDMQMFDEFGYNFADDYESREDYSKVSGALKRLTFKVTDFKFSLAE